MTITIETAGGVFTAYRADPAEPARAAVIVIQEVFGINAGIRRTCDRLAQSGYLALAPDLFWRIAPGVEFDPDMPAEMEQALGLMTRFDQDAAIGDIAATIRVARTLLPADGKVGAVGYCLGGRLAFMTATRTDIDASVGYYGVGIDGLLGEARAIARPVLLHVPQEDHFVDKAAQRRMHDGLDEHPQVTLYDYPDEDHGFAAQLGKRRSENAATLADGRTQAFLAEHLH